MKHVRRGGRYLRVVDPSWDDPLDTSFAERAGGRWNPAGRFGALYLNATVDVAAANARRNFAGEIATLFDLRPAARPQLQVVAVRTAAFVDAVTAAGLRAVRLPAAYPAGTTWRRTQQVAAQAYAARERGIACRSAALPEGEELAVFDRHVEELVDRGERIAFAHWYPVDVARRVRSRRALSWPRSR